MFHHNKTDDDHDCDCEPKDSKVFQLAMVVLPAVLPVIFAHIGDNISEFIKRKRELEDAAASPPAKEKDSEPSNGNK